MSLLLMKLLCAEYALILAVCLFEGNWKRALYWLGASILQVSIVWMNIKP
jgi:hypothetical protein